jgi:hypothetical protein
MGVGQGGSDQGYDRKQDEIFKPVGLALATALTSRKLPFGDIAQA